MQSSFSHFHIYAVSVCLAVFCCCFGVFHATFLSPIHPYALLIKPFFSESPALPKEMQDNARTAIVSKTTLKYTNLFSSVKATVTDVIKAL